MRETVGREAWDAAACHYGAAVGHAHLDASLLQMVELRYIRADNPRFQATFAAIEKALRRGEHMLRYDSEDDFGLPETAFNICTFWQIGRASCRERVCQYV